MKAAAEARQCVSGAFQQCLASPSLRTAILAQISSRRGYQSSIFQPAVGSESVSKAPGERANFPAGALRAFSVVPCKAISIQSPRRGRRSVRAPMRGKAAHLSNVHANPQPASLAMFLLHQCIPGVAGRAASSGPLCLYAFDITRF
jgi:hypothetical protein